jgi:hypothetical protein
MVLILAAQQTLRVESLLKYRRSYTLVLPRFWVPWRL